VDHNNLVIYLSLFFLASALPSSFSATGTIFELISFSNSSNHYGSDWNSVKLFTFKFIFLFDSTFYS